MFMRKEVEMMRLRRAGAAGTMCGIKASGFVVAAVGSAILGFSGQHINSCFAQTPLAFAA
jgi:hypothetical protein